MIAFRRGPARDDKGSRDRLDGGSGGGRRLAIALSATVFGSVAVFGASSAWAADAPEELLSVTPFVSWPFENWLIVAGILGAVILLVVLADIVGKSSTGPTPYQRFHRLMDGLHKRLERLSRYMVWTGGLALLCGAIMVTVDVISRKYIGVTMSGSDEISGYIFAGATTWAYSYCVLHRANIRIDVIYNLLPRPVGALLDVVGVSALLLYMGLLTKRGIVMFEESIEFGAVSVSTLAVPLWIPQLIWLFGLLVFVFTLVFLLFYSLTSLLRTDFETVGRLAGVLTVDEEIEEDTRGTEADKSRKTKEA